MSRKDLQDRSDVDLLIRRFYEQVMIDEQIGYLFTRIAKIDLETHLPKISAFWEMALFGTGGYQGNPMRPHLELHHKEALLPSHFQRWLHLFDETVDALFSGSKAEEAKTRAHHMAALMEFKTAGSERPGFIQ